MASATCQTPNFSFFFGFDLRFVLSKNRASLNGTHIEGDET